MFLLNCHAFICFGNETVYNMHCAHAFNINKRVWPVIAFDGVLSFFRKDWKFTLMHANIFLSCCPSTLFP